ncbi:hypothetical protein WH52_02910 [Tenacibaculum holothuriorum]|uniref:DUF4230 domain-containing protein n=1 Tax=Tenacibaculum holothuriorum TaxID=1635173 RepID=A0A1Y2PDY0_9FLAO|nr:DUF4230 domain-containing protein [Tenacibaculum holothuriorum]OSY88645.1 hypothetical protein WH52_02910 [Tenacibaculum holothuriorum]
MRFLKYVAVFLLGFLLAKLWYEKKEKNHTQEETRIILSGIKNMSKLVVSEGTFSEILSYSDSKKYFYDYLSFDKKAVVTVNAKVEVGYDLTKLDLQIDSLQQKIIINKIPQQEIIIAPEVKYFDLQQSKFNTFSKRELNDINQKSIDKIKETIEVTKLQKEAKTRLFVELSKLYKLSSVFGWQVVDNTNQKLENFIKLKD